MPPTNLDLPMPELYLLGTGAAYSDGDRTTTMLAFTAERSTLLVDCGGDAIQRLLACGIDPATIDHLILTHEHPDHVAGFPLLMERLWLSGRDRPLPVHGPKPAIEQAKRCFGTFDTSGWKGMPAIEWEAVPLEEDTRVIEDTRWDVTATPGIHSVPVIGLRLRFDSGTVAYSCDTEYSEAIVRMSRDADILVHEAMVEPMKNHSTVEEAARVAAEARVDRLVLVHLPPGVTEADLAPGRKIFQGIEFGHDGGVYSI